MSVTCPVYRKQQTFPDPVSTSHLPSHRPHRGPLRPEACQACRGHRLWIGRHPRLIVNAKKIAPHIPVFDKSRRDDGSLSREDFAFDAGRNVYVCPQGKLLHTTGRIHDGRTLSLSCQDFRLRPLPAQGTVLPEGTERKIRAASTKTPASCPCAGRRSTIAPRSQTGRDAVRPPQAHSQAGSPSASPARRSGRVQLAAIAQNLRRLARLVVRPPADSRSPPCLGNHDVTIHRGNGQRHTRLRKTVPENRRRITIAIADFCNKKSANCGHRRRAAPREAG